MDTSSTNCSTTTREWKVEEEIAGYAQALQTLREFITFPFSYHHEAKKIGLKFSQGLLLYGPPGSGKTAMVSAVVRECGAHFTVISRQSVHGAHVVDSGKVLQEAFSEAAANAISGKPSVIFVHEIDALCPRRDTRGQQDAHLASQLAMLMDSNYPSSRSLPQVVVVASAYRLDAVEPMLRRSGRFDSEVEVTAPTEEERYQILKLYSKKLCLDPGFDLRTIAGLCNGYVGADLEALCGEALDSAERRSLKTDDESVTCCLTIDDWKHARSVVGPSITIGTTVEIPKVSWDDIGGLKDVKKKLQQAVEWPIKHSAAFRRLGLLPYRGVLLHGPPGCSKTTLAKAAAHAAQASFISLSGAEFYSMYVGVGESLLRKTFQKARLAAPSIIFFDEVDVVGARRGGQSSSNVAVGERLLSTLLTEMDGLEPSQGVLVLAATNRPQAIDAALMRPGRFDLVLYVPPPDTESRHEILKIHTRNMKVDEKVDLKQIAEDTDLFTGAELEGLCQQAGSAALREDIAATVVRNDHFQTIMKSLKPALTRQEIDKFSSFMKNPSRVPSSSVILPPTTIKEARKSRKSWDSLGLVRTAFTTVALLAGVECVCKMFVKWQSSLQQSCNLT